MIQTIYHGFGELVNITNAKYCLEDIINIIKIEIKYINIFFSIIYLNHYNDKTSFKQIY